MITESANEGKQVIFGSHLHTNSTYSTLGERDDELAEKDNGKTSLKFIEHCEN